MMSRIRGVFPLFLVTAMGIASGKPIKFDTRDKAYDPAGVWTFGPAFKEEQERKQQERYS